MKIAVISDIHGNHYALQEVLNEARNIGVDKILVLGDIVGYYYYPEKILNLLSEWDYEIIKGNHEVILQELYEKKISTEILVEKYGRGHEYALKKIPQDKLDWLFSLPVQKSLIIDGVSFQLNHGSPSSIDEYIYPDAPIAQLEKCNSKQHDFVLIGHSHYSFSYKCIDSILINCGSVGQSREKGGKAYWALINTDNKDYKIRVTSYSPAKLIQDIQSIESKIGYSSKILER